MTFSRDENITVIVLSGGLGNQLFQVAAGIHFSRKIGTQLVLDESLGSPRKSNSGRAEIFEFQLGELGKNTHMQEYSVIAKKLYGALLRSNVGNNNPIKVFRAPILNFSKIAFSGELGKSLSVVAPQNVGFSPLDIKVNEILVGYFQSYRYLDSESMKMLKDGLALSDRSERIFEEWNVLAKSERPLILHIRRGDYKKENFGLLSKSYYHNALAKIPKSLYERIWVFSDEIEEARDLLSTFPASHLRFIDTPGFSSALTLKIMSLGKGYILANSSFSYWAAKLSKARASNIIAPRPWFKSVQDPSQLIDPEWSREDASWF